MQYAEMIDPGFKIVTYSDNPIEDIIRIEKIGRTAYKSSSEYTPETAEKFVRMIVKRGHESVLEHGWVTVHITCDRGVSHEIVRHRLASYTQESTRYCNYGLEKFGGKIKVIKPYRFDFWDHNVRDLWMQAVDESANCYLRMVNSFGTQPQLARDVLPTCLATNVVMTANFREWRHFFKLRAANDAHPAIQTLARDMLDEFTALWPSVFDEIVFK